MKSEFSTNFRLKISPLDLFRIPFESGRFCAPWCIYLSIKWLCVNIDSDKVDQTRMVMKFKVYDLVQYLHSATSLIGVEFLFA